MKKIINILILAVSLVFTTSCDDFLDITPDGQVKRDELLNTKDGIEEAIYGVYAQLRSNSLYGQELKSVTYVNQEGIWIKNTQIVHFRLYAIDTSVFFF